MKLTRIGLLSTLCIGLQDHILAVYSKRVLASCLPAYLHRLRCRAGFRLGYPHAKRSSAASFDLCVPVMVLKHRLVSVLCPVVVVLLVCLLYPHILSMVTSFIGTLNFSGFALPIRQQILPPHSLGHCTNILLKRYHINGTTGTWSFVTACSKLSQVIFSSSISKRVEGGRPEPKSLH